MEDGAGAPPPPTDDEPVLHKRFQYEAVYSYVTIFPSGNKGDRSPPDLQAWGGYDPWPAIFSDRSVLLLLI